MSEQRERIEWSAERSEYSALRTPPCQRNSARAAQTDRLNTAPLCFVLSPVARSNRSLDSPNNKPLHRQIPRRPNNLPPLQAPKLLPKPIEPPQLPRNRHRPRPIRAATSRLPLKHSRVASSRSSLSSVNERVVFSFRIVHENECPAPNPTTDHVHDANA